MCLINPTQKRIYISYCHYFAYQLLLEVQNSQTCGIIRLVVVNKYRQQARIQLYGLSKWDIVVTKGQLQIGIMDKMYRIGPRGPYKCLHLTSSTIIHNCDIQMKLCFLEEKIIVLKLILVMFISHKGTRQSCYNVVTIYPSWSYYTQQ